MSLKTGGFIFIFSSPSGAGKTTLVKLVSKRKKFITSISHTTRKPRSNEIKGKDYHFVSNKNFKNLIEKNQFLEYAKVFDNYYGTSKKPVIKNLSNGMNVLFDIDWQGSQQLSKFKQLNLVKVFILPPNKEELEKRLIARNQDDKDAIKRRMLAYSKDVVHQKDYDYVLINDNVDDCFNKLKKIISKHLPI